MMVNWFANFKVVTMAAVMLFVSANGFAEDATPDTDATISGEVASPVSNENYMLGLELRPSYGSKAGKVGSENTLSGGIQFTKDVTFIYEQYINTVQSDASDTVGFKPEIDQGAARIKVANIWNSRKLGLTLSYENRSLLPWSRATRDAGQILANRNYIILKKDVAEGFTISFMETPVFILNTHTTYQDSNGVKQATENFENRVYVVPELSLMDNKLYIGFPIYLTSTSYNEGGTDNAARFYHNLKIWPEVTYTVATGIDVGLSFRSDNLVKDNFDGFQIGEGLEGGTTQIVLRASL